MNQKENLEEVLYQRLNEVKEQLSNIDVIECSSDYSGVIQLLHTALVTMYGILQERDQKNVRRIH